MAAAALLLALTLLAAHPGGAAAPGGIVIRDAKTLGDGAGHIQGLVVTLASPVDAAGLQPSHFTLGNCTCGNLAVFAGQGPTDTLVLRFDATGDSSALPTLRYAAPEGARLRGPAGSVANDTAPRRALDGAGPAALAADWLDLDANGKLDAVDVAFSEPVRDARAALSAWTAGGLAPTQATGAADDATLRLRFPEGLAWTVGSPPRLRATADGAQDLAGNRMAPFDSQPTAGTGSSPVRILAATAAGFGLREVNVTLSGNVTPTEDGHSAIFASDLEYHDRHAGGAAAMARVEHRVNRTHLTLLLDAPLAPGDDGVDQVLVRAGALRDASGLLLPPHGVPILVDRVAPSLDLQARATREGTRGARIEVAEPPAGGAVVEVRHALAPIHAGAFAAAGLVARIEVGRAVSLTGLAADTEHHFALQAVDRAGNRGPVATARMATPPDTTPPGAPVALQAPAGNVSGGALVLRWVAPADDGAAVASYELRWSPNPPTAEGFAAGTALSPPAPAAPGHPQEMLVQGLPRGQPVHFALRARDAAGNAGPLATATAAIPADTTTPPAFTANATLPAAPGAAVQVTWQVPTDPEGPVVVRGVVSNGAGARVTVLDRTVASPWTVTPPGPGTWYAHVAAFSGGGSTQAPPLRITSDASAPARVVDLRAEAAAAGGAVLQWTSPADPDGPIAHDVLWRPAGAAGWGNATVVRTPLTAAGPAHFNLTGLRAGSHVEVAVRGVDAAGNQAPVSNEVALDVPADLTPPQWQPALTAGPSAGATTLLRRPVLEWAAATDAESPVVYRYALTQDPAHAIGDGDPTTSVPRLQAELGAGEWHLRVRAESDGGESTTLTHAFRVETPGADRLAAWNRAIRVQVERGEAGNRLSWTLPADLPQPPAGLQVWVANSPFTLWRTLPSGGEEFADGSALHAGADAKASTTYAVTLYFDESPELGHAESPPDGLAALAAAQAGGAPRGGWAAWAIGGGAVLAAVGAAAVVWALVRRRAARPTAAATRTPRETPAADTAPEAAGWAAAAAGSDWDRL